MSKYYTKSSIFGVGNDPDDYLWEGDIIVDSSTRLKGDLIPYSNDTYNIGSTALNWLSAYIKQLFVDDTTFKLFLNSGNPQILFDGGDYLEFDRTSNTFSFKISSSPNPDLIIANGVLTMNNKIQINGGTTYWNKYTTGVNNGDVEFYFDTGDFWYFDSAADKLSYNVGSTEIINFQGTVVETSKDILPVSDSLLDSGSSSKYWAHTYTDNVTIDTNCLLEIGANGPKLTLDHAGGSEDYIEYNRSTNLLTFYVGGNIAWYAGYGGTYSNGYFQSNELACQYLGQNSALNGVNVTGHLKPVATATYQLGNSSLNWSRLYLKDVGSGAANNVIMGNGTFPSFTTGTFNMVLTLNAAFGSWSGGVSNNTCLNGGPTGAYAGSNSVFLGVGSGSAITTGGAAVTHVGRNSGNTLNTGNYTTMIGAESDVASGGVSYASALGYNAVAQNSYDVQLGERTVQTGTGSFRTQDFIKESMIDSKNAPVYNDTNGHHVKVAPGSVTQITSITTGVTLNATHGLITTVSAATGAESSDTFTVTNNKVLTTGDLVKCWIQDYSGTYATNGLPIVSVDNLTVGTFDIVISNAHSANALSGVLKIGFEVINV